MVSSRHQAGQELEITFQLSGESLANAPRLTGDVGAKGGDHAAVTGGIPMRARQVAGHDTGDCALSGGPLGRPLPDALAPRQREAYRLGRDSLLGSELAVQPAVSKAGIFGYRVHAGGADAALAEQAGG